MDELRLGARGPNVQLLQAALLRAGFSPGPADGIFGPSTDRALRDFQQDNALAADGSAGPSTLRALQPWMTGYRIHTIRPGDTFCLLARRFRTTVAALRTANPNVDPEALPVGGQLVIPLYFPVVYDNVNYTSRAVALCLRGSRPVIRF